MSSALVGLCPLTRPRTLQVPSTQASDGLSRPDARRLFRAGLCLWMLTLLGWPCQAAIWLVNAAGGGDFTDIQPAINTAAEGDLILVSPGRYTPFALSKAVMIRATQGRFVVDQDDTSYRIEVFGIPSGKRAGISGLLVDPPDMWENVSLSVHDCPGELIFEDVTFSFGSVYADALFDIQRCGNISITNLRIERQFTDDITNSMRITDSSVRISGSWIEGPSGSPLGCGGFYDGCPGGHGLRVIGSFVVLARTSVFGGDGTDALWYYGGDADGGDGGRAVYCQSSEMFILGSPDDLIKGGDGGDALEDWGYYYGCGGSGGDGFTGNSATISRVTFEGGRKGRSGDSCSGRPDDGEPHRGKVTHLHLLPFLDAADEIYPGFPFGITIESAEPLSPVLLLVSNLGGFLEIPGNEGPPLSALPGEWFFAVPAGTTDGEGHLQLTLTIAEDPAVQGFPLNLQAAVETSRGMFLSNSPARITGPDQNDCNRNGIPDDQDIENGTSHDCDENGVPDECQDTSADCNENGVWDTCDIKWGDSLDRNDNGIPDECEDDSPIYVDDDAPGDPGPGNPDVSDPLEDGTLAHPFDAVQEAIDAAIAPITIFVADGVYTGTGNRDLDFRGKHLLVRSEKGPSRTIVDAEGQGRGFLFQSGETGESRLVGFTITNGHADSGGGIFIDSAEPSIENCWILNCDADLYGGGVYGDHVAARFTGCRISGNRAGSSGGGCSLWQCAVEFSDSEITHNVAEADGGGIHVREGPRLVLRNCTVSNNAGRSAQYGGGIHAFRIEHMILEGCYVCANTGWIGGGVYISSYSHAKLIDCVISDNEAYKGGGIYGTAALRHVTMVHNRAGYRGGGMVTSEATLSHVIVWDNEATRSAPQIWLTQYGSIHVDYSDIEGGRDGIEGGDDVDWRGGNIADDPRLRNRNGRAVHLGADSPCIDAGNPGFVPDQDETDIDGEPRQTGGAVDIGADESRAWPGRGPRDRR